MGLNAEPKPANPKPRSKRIFVLLGILVALVLVTGGVVLFFETLDVAEDLAAKQAPKDTPDKGRFIEPVVAVKGDGAAIYAIAYDNEGKHLYSSSGGGKLDIWDPKTGGPMGSLESPGGAAHDMRLSDDNRWLVTNGGRRGTIYDLSNRKLLHKLKAHKRAVVGTAISHDGELVATSGVEGHVILHRRRDGAHVRTIEIHDNAAVTLAFMRDGETLIGGSYRGKVYAWSVASGEELFTLEGHDRPINDMLLADDDRRLFTASDDNTVRAWDLEKKKTLQTYGPMTDELWSLALSKDGTKLLAGGKSDILWTFNAQTAVRLDKRHAKVGGIAHLSIHPNGEQVAAAGKNGKIHVWKMPEPIWRPAVPPENYEPTLPERPKPTSKEGQLVAEAEELLDTYHASRDKLDQVDALLKRAENLNANYAPLYVQRARWTMKNGYIRGSRYQPGTLARATVLLEVALKHDPKSTYALSLATNVHIRKERLALAQKAAERASALDPDDYHSLLATLHIAVAQRRVEDAITAGKQLFTKHAANSRALSAGGAWLRDLYWHVGDIEAVESTYVAEIRYEPDAPWSRGNYADFLNRRSRYEEAITWAKSALDLADYGAGRHTLANAYAGLARQRAVRGELKAARESLAMANASFLGEHFGVAMASGIVSFYEAVDEHDAAKVDRALEHFRHAKQIEPKSTWADSWIRSEKWMKRKVKQR